MASILKIGENWRVQVRRTDRPKVTKTFARLEDAEAWAKRYETHGKGMTLPEEVLQLPRVSVEDLCGVYFLFKETACIYVGQSLNVHARVREHKHKKRIAFDEYAWIPVPAALLDSVEGRYIAMLRPEFNSKQNLSATFLQRPLTKDIKVR